jgi:hypothetical protein
VIALISIDGCPNQDSSRYHTASAQGRLDAVTDRLAIAIERIKPSAENTSGANRCQLWSLLRVPIAAIKPHPLKSASHAWLATVPAGTLHRL